jgi:drug/metabolite transporter (DMT)-like permease
MFHKGFLFSFGAAISFGIATPLVKLCSDNIPLFTYLTLVGFFALVLLVVYHVATNRHASWKVTELWKEYLILGIVSSLIPNILVYLGYRQSFGVNTAVLLRFEVFVALLFGIFFFHERISRRQTFGVVLGFFGIFVFVTKFQVATFLIGDVYLLLASAAYASFPILVKKMQDVLSATQINIARTAIALPFFAVGVLFEEINIDIVLAYMPHVLIGSVFLIFVVGVSCYATAVKYWDVWKVVFVAQFGSVLFGYVASAWMLGERLDMWQWVGTSIIVVGIVLVLWQNKPKTIEI